MSIPEITAVRLTASGSQSRTPKDTLIMGPGMGTGALTLFGALAHRLDERFQVIAYDLPGHVQSPVHREAISVADIAAAVVQLVSTMRSSGTIRPGSKLYFAGVSVSGQVALQLAIEYPEVFDGIAVISSAAVIGTADDWKQRAQLVREQGTEAMVEMSSSAWFAPGFAQAHPEKVASECRVLASADDDTYAQLCLALGAFDARAQLKDIQLPLLVVSGAHDVMCTPELGKNIADAVSGAAHHVLERSAHLAPHEQPDELAEIISTHFPI